MSGKDDKQKSLKDDQKDMLDDIILDLLHDQAEIRKKLKEDIKPRKDRTK